MSQFEDLIQAAHRGEKEARDQLVEENLGLVHSIVRRFSGRCRDLEDLFQIGCIGLMKAIDRFDTEYEVKFSTYAVPLILGEIKRFLRDDGMVRVSRSLKELATKARAMENEYQDRYEKAPTVEELAEALSVSREELAEALEASADVESLQTPIYQSDGSEILLMDKIGAQKDEMEEMLTRVILRSLLQELNETDKKIILLRYYYDQTQTQIAKCMGISQVQVSRIEKKVLRKMRERM